MTKIAVMERFGWTEKQLYKENTIDFYNQVIEEMNLRGQAEKMKAQKEKLRTKSQQRRARRR